MTGYPEFPEYPEHEQFSQFSQFPQLPPCPQYQPLPQYQYQHQHQHQYQREYEYEQFPQFPQFEQASRLVRPFTITGGRTQPSRNIFTLITIVRATAFDRRGPGLQREHLRALDLCAAPAAVAEIAAHLDLPVSVTKILLSDLLDQGRITATAPAQGASGPDIALLRKVRDGLARL